MNRWACLHDLNNYFKKKDLLGGLTEPEKQKVRQNIGVLDAVGDGGKAKPVEINSKSLQELIKGNGLIPGVRYRILDFQTIYNSDTEVWGKDTNPSVVWHLIVIANTNNTLDSRVFIEEHLDWIVEYDITPVKMSDGSFNKGTITYLKDSNGNQAYYDFKNIKFKRDSGNYYTFSDIIGDLIMDSSELQNTKYNILEKGCYNNVFIGDTYNNILQPNCVNNTFLKGGHNNVIGWESVNNVFNEPVRFVSGSIYNKLFAPGDTTLSTTITKTILKVNDVDLVSFLDPITYSYLVIII